MSHKRFVIVGAGISGLSLAWFLKKKWKDSAQITVVESSDRVGGHIRTDWFQGACLEKGPRGFRPKGKGMSTLALARDLSLEDLLLPASSVSKQRFILQKGRIVEIPSSFISLLRNYKFYPHVFSCLKEVFKNHERLQRDESIDQFFCRHFGKEFAQELIDPLVTGIYGGDSKHLSIASCFPLLKTLEEKSGSLIKGFLNSKKVESPKDSYLKEYSLFPLISFRGGMGVLTDALREQLEAKILLSQKVKAIDFKKGRVLVQLPSFSLEADHVFITLGPQACQELLPKACQTLKSTLQKVATVPMVTVNVVYHHLPFQLPGFGYLIPSQEREDILGVTFDSCIFPENNQREKELRLTVMMGGARHSHLLNLSLQNLQGLAIKSLQRHLGFVRDPDFTDVHVTKEAIPQFFVGYEETKKKILQEVEQHLPFATLTGQYMSGVGVNDCIDYAKNIAFSAEDLQKN